MSFQNKGLWMGKSADGLTDGEMAYDGSIGSHPKRARQWFMDGGQADFFPCKTQTAEVSSSSFFSGMPNFSVPSWGNATGFQPVPGQYTERLFDSDTARTINLDDRNIPSISTENMNLNMGKKVEDPFGIDCTYSLSTSHKMDDPRSSLNLGGIRKVKVSQVTDSDSAISLPIGRAYATQDDDPVLDSHVYAKLGENALKIDLTYNGGNVSIGDTFNRESSNFMLMGQHYNKANESISQTYDSGNNNLTMSHNFKDNNGSISIGQSWSSSDSTAISIGQSYSKDENDFGSRGHATHTLNKGDARIFHSNHTYEGNNDNSSFGHAYNKGGSSIISFGNFHDEDETDPSGRLICNYDLLMGQASVQRSESLNERDLLELNASAFRGASQVTVSGAEPVKKKGEQKVSKKVSSNNFPSNVRSLLSTGMLDGVPVKYIAWSREKELRGVIKASGYLCGCQSCNSSKIINAYEFERHAGCKTKHPNNHIYFENGKTIYGIVQELRSTPQNLLFEVIQTITGSSINQKSFRLWKESFLAATRELQRIYGNDEVKQAY